MTSIYEITNDQGDTINRIVATPDYVEATYPGRFKLVEVDAPDPAPTIYKVITPPRYLVLIRQAAQMTNAEFAAYATDTEPDVITAREIMRSVSGTIDINIPDNMALVMEGLGYMAAHGHTGQIAPADFPATILAAWATL